MTMLPLAACPRGHVVPWLPGIHACDLCGGKLGPRGMDIGEPVRRIVVEEPGEHEIPWPDEVEAEPERFLPEKVPA